MKGELVMSKTFTSKDRAYMAELVQKHGKSGPEIAKEMNCSTHAVYYQLNIYAQEHGIPKDDLRVCPQKVHVFSDPDHKTWPIGSHQNIYSEKIKTNVEKDASKTGVEDTTATTIDESPKEETPEANVEDIAATTVMKDASEDDIDKLIDIIRKILAKNIEIINKLN